MLDRECKRAHKTLPDILRQKQEAILKEIANSEDICKLLPPERSEPVPSTWDISVIASVILISFSNYLNQSEVEKIELLRDARNQYALTALSLVTQESDDLFEKSTVLIHSLTSLSADLELQIRQKLDLMIQKYPKWEVHEDDTIDKYLNELEKQGANIKSIEDLYKEQMDHLRNTLRHMDENGIHFKRPHEFQIKIVTKCNEEETKRSAEDKLEKVYNTALANDSVDTSHLPLEKEVGKLMRRLSDHPDVKVFGVKRNCITLFLSCSTCQGILHVIDYISGQHFSKINCRISDELSYMYGETFVVRGNITLESIYGVLKDPRNESGPIESGLSLAIECASSEGIRHVLSVFGNTETTNGFNQISDMLSSTYETRVSVQGFADLKELSELYQETDTDTSDSSRDLDEDDRLRRQSISGVKDNVKLTYSEDEPPTLKTNTERRIEEKSVHTEQMNVEDSEPKEKPTLYTEFSKEENGILTEHTYNELHYQEREMDSTVTVDELQCNTNNMRETAKILSEVCNQVNNIRTDIAKEMHSLNVKKTSVTENLVMFEHQTTKTDSTSILTKDKPNLSFSDDFRKYDELKELSQSVMSKFDENVCALLQQTLKEVEIIVLELADCVSTWRDNFKCVYVGLADYREIDEIALGCSHIWRNMHDLRHKILPLLFNIHVDCEWATDELDIYEHKLDRLFNDFTQSTFLVTEQDGCFIKMGGRQDLPCLTARILVAENMPRQSNKIEAILLSEQDINDIFYANDNVKHFLMAAKERSLHLASSQIYSTTKRHASFKKMRLKEKYPRKEFTLWEQEYKKKYRIVFTTTIANRQYWTLSLPMTMIHDSKPYKEFLACTSIMWQCYGVDVFKLPLQSNTELPWTKVEEILQAKFMQLTSVTPLSNANLLYLKDKLFGTTDVPDSRVVSFEEFCMNKMGSTASTKAFWKWVTDAYKLIENYLIDFWKKGLIVGFISKDDAELYLTSYNTLKHGTFILRFSENHVPNTGNVRNEYVQLRAYVLTITEENVAISNLESTVYRALCEYLDRKDKKAPEPRWLFLTRHCSLPIIEKDQKQTSAKPGSKFLDELDKHAYKISDLADMLRKHGMHDGLDILHATKIDEDSVSAISEYVFRKIGRALEELHESREPCWYYIMNHYDTLDMSRKDQRNIGKSSKSGEKFLEIFSNCKCTLTDLKTVCEKFKMQGVLDVLASKRLEGYLQKTLDDVVIGGEMEFRAKKLLDILQDKRSPDGSQMLRYIYPGEYTLDGLFELYG